MENNSEANPNIHKHLFNYFAYLILIFSVLGLIAIIVINKNNASTIDLQASDANRDLMSCRVSLKASQFNASKCVEQNDSDADGVNEEVIVLQSFEIEGIKFNVEKIENKSDDASTNFNFYINVSPESEYLPYAIVNTPQGAASNQFGTESLVSVMGNILYVADANDNSVKIYRFEDLDASNSRGESDSSSTKIFRLIDVAILPQIETYPIFYINCNQSTCAVITARHIEAGCSYTLDTNTLEFTPKYKCQSPAARLPE